MSVQFLPPQPCGHHQLIWSVDPHQPPRVTCADCRALLSAEEVERLRALRDPSKVDPLAVARAALEAAARKCESFADAEEIKETEIADAIRALDPAAIVAGVAGKP